MCEFSCKIMVGNGFLYNIPSQVLMCGHKPILIQINSIVEYHFHKYKRAPDNFEQYRVLFYVSNM